MQKLKLTQKQKIIVSVVAVILIAGFGWSISKQLAQPTSKVLSATTEKIITATETKSQSKAFFIEVVGQVKNPGVYQINKEMIVLEAIEMAGGFNPDADLQHVHKNITLSAVVQANQKIYIPAKNETSSPNTSGDTSQKISINSASRTELMTLSGVGEVTADKIIAGRPYKTLEELKEHGVGESLYAKIINQLVL